MDYNILTAIALGGLFLSLVAVGGLALYILTRVKHDDETAVRVYALEQSVAEGIESSVTALDLKLSVHIIALAKRANHAHENIVTLIDSQNIQRAELDATVDALQQHSVDAVAEFKKIAQAITKTQGFTAATEGRVIGIEQAITQLQHHFTGLSEQAVKRLLDLNDKIDGDLVDRLHFEYALRGAADFGEFVRMYIKQSGD